MRRKKKAKTLAFFLLKSYLLRVMKLILSSLILCVLSLSGHFYLSKRSYQLDAGQAGKSAICDISEAVNCDKALTSNFGKVFEISISSFGTGFFLVLIILLSLSLYSKNPLRDNVSFYMSVLSVLGSLFFGAVSLIYKIYCPVCLGLYALSLLNLIVLFLAFKKDLLGLPYFLEKIKNPTVFVPGILVLVIGFFLHIVFVNNYSLKENKEMLKAIHFDWKSRQKVSFPSSLALKKGSSKEELILTEIVDLLCPACATVKPALDKILYDFPNLSLHVFFYSSDKTCNPESPYEGPGLSCDLAKISLCAKEQGKEKEVYDWIFKNQGNFLATKANKKAVSKLLDKMSKATGVNLTKIKTCQNSPKTNDALLKHINKAMDVGLPGTPAFFLDGKYLPHGSYDLKPIRYLLKKQR